MKKKNKKKYLTCQNCGAKDETVQVTYDPYALDVNDETIEVIICDYCYGERAADI